MMDACFRQALAILGFLLASSPLFAQQSSQALTLEMAIASIDAAHPDLLMAQAERDVAQADLNISASRTDSIINLEGILRRGSQKNSPGDFLPDNSVRLSARKTLYDFGRSNAAVQASRYDLNAKEADLITAKDQRRLEVMSRFFEVLIADMQYTADNELMAIIFVGFDQGKDNLTAGKISAVELSGLEANFQNALLKRTMSAQKVRLTRAILANAMHRPGSLPGELEDPKLPGNNRIIPEYEDLLAILQRNNPRLLAYKEILAGTQKRVDLLRTEYAPSLEAEVQAGDFSRSSTARDNLSAGLIFTWPLYQGSRADARIARELAQLNKARAGLEKLKIDLSQSLLETYLEIVQLQGSGRKAAQKQSEYRDLLLERSRGLYELELKSNLGSAMAETVEANIRVRKNEYLLALDFARLEALLGVPLEGKEELPNKMNDLKDKK